MNKIKDNKQGIFNRIYTHLLTQNKRSSKIGYPCAYRGENNLMCAAGCLIPDEKYNPNFEGRFVSSLSFFKENYPNSLNLIRDCQIIHDFEPIKDWKNELVNISF